MAGRSTWLTIWIAEMLVPRAAKASSPEATDKGRPSDAKNEHPRQSLGRSWEGSFKEEGTRSARGPRAQSLRMGNDRLRFPRYGDPQ